MVRLFHDVEIPGGSMLERKIEDFTGGSIIRCPRCS